MTDTMPAFRRYPHRRPETGSPTARVLRRVRRVLLVGFAALTFALGLLGWVALLVAVL